MEVAEIFRENPFNPSPRGDISDIKQLVGREEIIVVFWELVNQASKNKFIPMILRAPYGGGKTTILRWLRKSIEERENIPKHILNKNVFVAYTKLPHPSVKSITTTFLDSVKIGLDSSKKKKLQEFLRITRRKLRKTEIQSENIYQTQTYKNSLDVLYSLGYDVIIHIIDEFEAIAEISNEECRGFLHEFRDFIDEIGNRPLVMILGCTDEAYRLMEEIHPALVSRVPEEFRKNIDMQLRFTLENTLDFVATRIEAVRDFTPDSSNPYYPFDRESLELLYERTRGNVRVIEQVCYFALEKALKQNARINQEIITEALHQVVSQKSGPEHREGIYNIIDDPKERESIVVKLRKGNPEDLKDLIYNGFRTFLAKQNFDYQFEREFDLLGDKAGIIKTSTHAYRTVPINIVFLPTLTPKNFGHSDVVDIERIRKNMNAGLAILLRITEIETGIEFPETNVMDLLIPIKSFEEFSILPYASHLDAEKACRKIDEELQITTNINRWIRERLEKGQVIGERFKQHELSVYLLLWRLGDFFSSTESVYRTAKQRNRKFSKATLIARLESLEAKKLVLKKDDTIKWTVSPLVKEIYTIITQEFKANPVTSLDIRSYFLGGTVETLQKYLRMMVEIGILTSVKVGGHTAYKTENTESIVLEAAQKQESFLKQIYSDTSKLPNTTRQEVNERISLLQDSLKRAQQNLENHDEVLALVDAARVRRLIDEITELVTNVKEQSALVENEYTWNSNTIEHAKEHIQKCQAFGIDVLTYTSQLSTFERENKKAYESEFKTYGRINVALDSLNRLQTQVNEINENLSKMLDLHSKLIENLNKSRQILNSISTICEQTKISKQVLDENLGQLRSLLTEAEKALEVKEFARAEFLFLKLLQNDLIRRASFEVNMKYSEISSELSQVKEMAIIASRLSNDTEFVLKIQNIETTLQETKILLEKYDLANVIPRIEKVNTIVEKLRKNSMGILLDWFSSILPKDTTSTPYELSKTFNVPFETVLQATFLLLRSNKLAVSKR